MRRPWRWTVVLFPGALLWYLPYLGLTAPQRHLLSVFVATILSLIAQPVPMGVSALVAMTFLAITGTLPPARVLSGFSNLTVWLVFAAFLFARAVTATRLGQRIAYGFIHRFGRSTLSLGYSLAGADLLLAPFVPSDTARSGGVLYPVARSVAEAAGSTPGPTAGVIGTFLMLVGFHATYTASAMFLTAMAANPLIADFAMKQASVQLTWGRWAEGAIVPGLIALALVPLLLHRLARPTMTDTAPARAHARDALAALGPLTGSEKQLIVVMVLVMAGWITTTWHGVPSTFVALAGVSALLLLGVLGWEDLLGEKRAWDALVWFAPLLMMADALNDTGVIATLSHRLFAQLAGFPWPLALLVLLAGYLYLHYGFASMTAHVTALYPGFVGAALVAGAPPLLSAMALGYFSSLDAALTHYGTGSAPIYFGSGYVTQGQWWRIGFLVSLLQLAIWLGVGMLWWKLIGWW